MKKRVMSLLLVMLMVFALLPAAALAADPVNPAQVDETDLHMTKTLSSAADGTYTLTLESWATGETIHQEGQALPTDIVLVLDQSGSMSEDMTDRSVTIEELYKTVQNSNGETLYFVRAHLNTYVVSVVKNGPDSYTVTHKEWLGFGTNTLASNAPGSTLISGLKISRLNALKIAVDDFIDSVAAKGKGHRIAITGFASNGYNNTEIFSGSNSVQYETVFNAANASTDYAAYSLKETDAAGVSALKASVRALNAEGGTLTDDGMELAERILQDRKDAAGRGSAVILFTDGNPGTSGGDLAVANNTVKKSNDIKQAFSAKVFSVGVFPDANGDQAYISAPYTIEQFMEGVSSMYTGVENLSQLSSHTADTSAAYYQKITGNTGSNTSLSDLFETISEAIDIPTTNVQLDSDSVLRDVIKSSDFIAAGATVLAQAVKMAADTPDAEIALSYPATVPADGVVNVTGFDYSQLFHTDAHPGYKLVVTISGLTPKHSGDLSSNTTAGIFENTSSTETVISIDTPTLLVDKQAKIIDFNAKMTIADGIARWKAVNENNGTFADGKNAGELTYQLKPTETLGDRSGSLIMNGVDTAMAYNGTEWKEYQAIPANNIYFDDALLSKTVDVGDGSGYNAGVTSAAAQAVTEIADHKDLVFTFKGTGIDVYCTTNAAGGYVQAGLMTGDSAIPENLVYFESADGHYYKDGDNYVRIDKDHPAPDGAQRYDSSLLAVRNYSITPAGEGDSTLDRYNVPTVSYTGLPYGTYTVRLWTVENANYKLDGIRVYNAMADDESVYAGTNEANARFYNLREALVNDGRTVTVKKDDESQTMKAFLAGEDDASEVLPGVLFIDDKDSVKLEKTVVDKNGSFVLDENGEPQKELVYQDAFSAYVANGPKNEIYLAKDQGIAFNISAAARGDHYWVGLSIPDQGSATPSVTVNDQTLKPSVASAVDMYYPITPRPDGTVVIVNHGDAMIAVTNLKVTKAAAADPDDFPGASPFALLSTEALDLAANSSEVLSQDDGGDPGMQELIRQLISSFVRALFDNITRLFGK